MSYIIFHRESNNFSDILSDKAIKNSIRLKMSFRKHLIVELADDKHTAYLMIKYGDDVVEMSHIIPDRTPIPNKDYVPERKNKSKPKE